MKTLKQFLCVSLCAAILAGCGGASKQDGFKPIDPAAAVFWDRQTTESAELLQQLAAEFNQSQEGLPIKVEHTGNYTDIFRKVSASIRAGMLPAMAVAYESMTAEYAQAGAVVPLDTYIQDLQQGLSQADLDDFFPAALETNRYADFDNQMLSFPFCKSVLMMYFNKQVLAEAGLAGPPQTWDEFLEQCRQVKSKTGKYAYAISVDCSTINGMIFSMGGQVVEGRKTLYDSPESAKVFALYETLIKEDLAYQIQPRSYDDEAALAENRIAFLFRSSSGKTNVDLLMGGDRTRWGLARIPQADPSNPQTVLYGPNICIFKTSEDQQLKSWQFVKYFTSPEVSARWALGTGYLPIRKSVMNDPATQAFWAEWEYNRAAFDCLPFAKSEPKLAGWQEVRTVVEKALTEVLSGVKPANQAAADLKLAADAVLAGD